MTIISPVNGEVCLLLRAKGQQRRRMSAIGISGSGLLKGILRYWLGLSV